MLNIATLRRYAIARSLGAPATLQSALDRLGFVQADPIRAPARAQDLTLRHRVDGYRAGDLERAYPTLDVAEDFFVNYGFLPTSVQALMHPRGRLGAWPRPGKKVAQAVLSFVRERGEVHPRQADAHFAHGAVTNYWGGSSSATTRVLDHLHYRGLVRVSRREQGIRLYAPQDAVAAPTNAAERRARVEALVDRLIALYAPVPAPTLAWLMNRLEIAVPQWTRELAQVRRRVARRTGHARVDGVEWYWPAEDDPTGWAGQLDGRVRLLAPFDPIVWDRRRFERFWTWPYRFEAYTPARKRQFGYYALPLLWGDSVRGWATVSGPPNHLDVQVGFPAGRPRPARDFARALDAERSALQRFLGADPLATAAPSG